MSTDLSSDWTAFNQFVSEQLGGNLQGKSLEESVEEFRAYQKDLAAIREKLRISAEQSARGESSELDMDEFFKEIDAELDQRGIPE